MATYVMGEGLRRALELEFGRAGAFRARDASRHGISSACLARLHAEGVLERVNRGVYRLVAAPATELHGLAVAGKRVPHGAVCLLSALQVHGLTTEVPHAVWLMIGRSARMPKVAYPKLEIVRASGAARTHGIETREIEGVTVQLTSAAKTVADCFRYRKRVGLDVALDGLREYLRKGRGRGAKAGYSIDALVEAAKADRAYNVMRPYLEALA